MFFIHMKALFYCLALIYLCILIFSSCQKNETSISCQYDIDIKPIITAKCAIPSCHASGSTLPDLSDYTILKTWVDNGRFRANIYELKIMPPASAVALTNEEKNIIKCWLDNGATKN